MAFTECCVIRKSNPSLWRQLMGLGIRQNRCVPKLEERTMANQMCVVVEKGTFFTMKQENVLDCVYDCGTNIDLFLALAVLRDDTDIHQWFIYDNRDWNDKQPMRGWHLCKQDSIMDDMAFNNMYQDCEKATRLEIIAHFTGMDDDEIFEDVYGR